ncbi:OprD family outer membrane porin [Campylobacter corcagiensis]|uniref:Outer membrane porin, OprD family n=1 Tax=Campylobacter corcagiensis TaxID=1448857 RepID=A0A7M1LJ86_9BACT|nr:OprD family outer membrane porin [Campylobacter corcagiensis]QKF64232.1 outer membrane porin, OprD family [Campylobacter corcagiensis]QOQ87575.1 outer membrane porin, OprD family [Campylobacter corcagiensis]
MRKFSLILALMLSANAADNLADAFTNGKFSGEIKAWYWDKSDDSSPYKNENITNFAIELGYKTDKFYGFYLGTTGQIAFAPIGNEDSKAMYHREQNTKGFVPSELYLGYNFSKTDIKIGNQYINTPLVGVNGSRIFKESFSGVTINSKYFNTTTLYAGYADRFSGRTSATMNEEMGSEPKFKRRITIGGATDFSHKFSGLIWAGLENKSIQNLTLSVQYAFLNGVELEIPRVPTKHGDINMYYTEASYAIPLKDAKLKFDLNFRGSKTSGAIKDLNYDGWMLGAMAGVYDLNGFDIYAAATTVSSNDSVIMGAGLGSNSYTSLPIRGPFMYTALAGMDSYKFGLAYNFSNLGAKGLKAIAQYSFTNHDPVNKRAGTLAPNLKREFDGYSLALNYNLPFLKGLSASLIYVSLEEERTNMISGSKTDIDTDELWLKFGYKFSI